MNDDFRKEFLACCPVCQKAYDKHWKVVNHIRKTKDEQHQELLQQQENQLIRFYTTKENFYEELVENKNIFSGIAFANIIKILHKQFSKEKMEIIRKNKISKTMKTLEKTDEHNQHVSEAVIKAWKDGKFHTPENVEARRKGIEGRRSFSGSGNPMYGKASPKGSGRGKGGIRKDIGHYVRSTWEANFCRILKLFNREYTFEKERFFIKIDGRDMSYCPDLVIKKNNKFYEIKGHAKSSVDWICDCKNCVKGRAAIKELKKQGIKVVIIGKKEYNLLKRHFKEKINWEQ